MSAGSISGSAVEHNNELYTLNLVQQNQLIDFINGSVQAKEQNSQSGPVDIKRILIYQFDLQPEIEISPLSYDSSDNLIFTFEGKLRHDTSGGKLKKLLSETYDH